MLKNYLKIAWRSLQKNKLYSIVNIGGLTAGITCCLLICLYLMNELSYDRFHKSADRIVRATTEYTVNGVINRVGKTGSMVGPRFASVFPEVQSFVRILGFEPYTVQYGEQSFVEKGFRFADSTFFQIFSFPLIEGDPKTALDAPYKLVITRSMEKKYFGNEKALGKVVRIGGTRDYIVSGVSEDVPANSQIQFDFIASFASLRNSLSWGIEVYATYFLLRPNTNVGRLEENIISYMKRQTDLDLTGNDYLIFHLEPLTRVHLFSDLDGLEPNGNITYIYILAAIALLILCIASVNYTNLATAQAARRLPEIGVRKVLGSARWQIFWQFIGESLLLNAIAFILAIWLSLIMLPYFNKLVEKSLSFKSFFNFLV
ncbi:MAG TPA: ABC transporter permease, partial [Puia sp.]|nr:ABC transporter permease [Puia sp.]